MKKLLSLALIALFGASAATVDAAPTRSDLVAKVDTCWAILQEFMSDPATAIPLKVWQHARAVLITNQFKGGFIVGVKGGYGVIVVKKPSGRWSNPVLVSASEVSLGFQIGGKSVETVYIITDDQTPRLLFRSRFNIGVDAKAVAGPHAAEAESDNRPILSTPVLVYSKSSGLFAGATVKAADVARNDADNYILYNTNYGLPELLYSDWVETPADLQPLPAMISRYAP